MPENTSVRVKCSLPRVYPELSKQSMVMKIKNEPFYPGVGERNMHPDNSSYKYEIIETIMATKDYNEEEILCEVKPTLGDIKRKSRTLRVLCKIFHIPFILSKVRTKMNIKHSRIVMKTNPIKYVCIFASELILFRYDE